MSLTVANLITNFDTFIGDTSTDRISAAERLQYMTEATIWLQEELKNDHMVKTYDLAYLDTVNYYEVTTPLADLLDGADLRRTVGKNFHSMTHKSSREMAEDIANGIVGDDSWSIERRDNIVLLAINATPQNRAIGIDNFSGGVGNWTADITTSDATNITWDQNNAPDDFTSLNYDIDVSQSVNNRAGIVSTAISMDLSQLDNVGVFLIDAWVPDVTFTSSFTIRWGTDSSNYWTTTVTTDIDGDPFASAEWMVLAFDWLVATTVGTPDETDINYFRFDVNYTGSQTDDTDYRYANFRVAQPETLKFYYVSFVVGTDTTGVTDRIVFTATSDIPFFSGKYDQYKYAVAHMAASMAFDNLRLKDDAMKEESRAQKALDRARRIFPQSITKEVKSFKVQGINLSRPAHFRRWVN